MASRRNDSPGSPASAARALVYVACPDCGRAVRLSDENRVSDGSDAYECPNCGARFVFSAKAG